MSKSSEILSQIVACTSSGKEYVKNSKTIFENFAKNTKDYGKNFFISLNQILGGKEYAPTTKFYALFLLLQVTETKKLDIMTQFAEAQDLLDKLLTEAQFDASKALKDKGKKFFSPTPTKEESIIGHNYVIMVLEGFNFWKSFTKTEEAKNPLNSFHKVHAALAKSIAFPKVNIYVGYGSKIPNEFHLQPAKVEEPIDFLNSEAFSLIVAYASSEGQDKDCIQYISTNVKKNDETYDLTVLKSVCEILSKPEYSVGVKFHTLYLFVEVIEKGNLLLLDLFTKETTLFRLFYSQAKEASDALKVSSKSKTKAPKDQESIVRNQYYTLLLEAIKFWNESYGTTDENSFCINFYRLHASLVKDKVAFPDKYTFLSSKDTQKTREAELKRLVQASIPSGPDFERNYQSVIRAIEKDPRNIPIYLSITQNLLSATTKLPFSSRFYALYLFVKVTETGNDDVLVGLASSKVFINEIFKDAQFDRKKPVDEKGKTFFKQNPKAEESVLGSNYVELLTEAILYWGRVYGTESKPKVMLKAMSDQLLKVTEVTGEEYYINKDFKAMDQKTLQKFEYIPFRSLPKNTKKAERKNQAPVPEVQIKQQPQVQAQPRTSASGNSQSKQVLRELDQKIEMYEYSKTMLKECIIENEQENEDINEVIDFLLQEVTNSYNNEVGKYLEPVLESDHPEKENYLKIILKEGETVEELNRLRANHKQGNISYKEFAQRSLILLGQNVGEEAPIPTPIPNQQVVEEEIKYAPELPKDEVVVRGEVQEFLAASLLDDKETPRKPQKVDFQEFLANSLLDDEETPKIKPKEESIPITATSTKFKKLNLSRDTANKGVVPKFKAGDLEDDKNARVDRITNPIPTPISTPKKEIKPSKMNQSEKLSPEKEFAINKLGQSMRSSKVRMESLLNMENSIKKSYINSGKQPPNFKGLDSNTKLEHEIVKLRQQKDELNKQNAILKNKSGDVVYVAEEPSPDNEKEVNSLKLLLADYQLRIDDVQRQLEAASPTKFTSPAFSSSPQVISEGNRDLDRELANLHKEVDTLRRSINTPLRLTSDFNNEQRDSINHLEQQRSQSVMQGRYLSIQPLTSRDDGREKVLLSKANYSFNTERESFTTRDKKSQLDQFMSSPQTYRWEEMYERTSVKRNQNSSYTSSYIPQTPQSSKPECYRNNLFAPLKLRLKDTMESPQLIHNFKMNCLKKSGGVLFENNDLHVSISVNNVNSLSFSPQSLQFTLVYCNKTRNLFSDVTAEFVELNQASFFNVPEVYKSAIPGEYELRQQVIFTFAEWSLQVPQVCVSYKNLKGRKDVDIFLPILISQFLEYKPTTLDSFCTLFNQADNIIVEGDEMDLDTAIIKSNIDFSKYLEDLINLNPLQNQGEDTVFGAVFRTKWQISSYFLKINITPSKKVRFTVSTHVENETFVDVILETLQFLFARDYCF